jgi:hypothetical protein
MFFIIRGVVIASLAIFASAGSDCNAFNNDCRSCIQYAGQDGQVPVHSCTFCFKDGTPLFSKLTFPP